MVEGKTSPPKLLNEADLISLMDKHGIGTDATHAEHIETIKTRQYVGLKEDNRFLPGYLGLGLVEGYDDMGYYLAKPDLRAQLEADLKAICEGRKTKNQVLLEQIALYRGVFENAEQQIATLGQSVGKYFGGGNNPPGNGFRPGGGGPGPDNDDGNEPPPGPGGTNENLPSALSVTKCPKCTRFLELRKMRRKEEGNQAAPKFDFFLGCPGYQDTDRKCDGAVWLPKNSLDDVSISDKECENCQSHSKKLTMKFSRGKRPEGFKTNLNTACLICDERLTRWRALGGDAVATEKQCKCQPAQMAVKRQVKKEGVNKGRWFYGCAMSREAGCGYFEWATENPTGSDGQQGARTAAASNQLLTRRSSEFQQPNRGYATGEGSRGQDVQLTQQMEISFAEDAPRSQQTVAIANSGPICQCFRPSLRLMTKKPGRNQGREFYTCAEKKCKFFQWIGGPVVNDRSMVDVSSDNPFEQYGNGENRAPSVGNGPKCSCGAEASLRTARSGQNPGRQFFCCSLPQNDNHRCKFFQWAD